MTHPDSPLAETLAFERRVWDALCTGDADADRHLLHPDFVGLYPTGYAGRDAHADITDAAPRFASYELSDERVIEISDRARLLTYRASFRRTADAPSESMWVSSLWTHEPDGWRNRFSQDTPDESTP